MRRLYRSVAHSSYDESSMQEYDIALKLALGSAEETMRELTGGAVCRWLNVELPEVRGSRVDLLGESDAGELVHIELQSSNDPPKAVRHPTPGCPSPDTGTPEPDP
jgi:hypothetical protein